MVDPTHYCSMIVDDATRSAFGLPHFLASTKADRGRVLKTRLVSLLKHSNPPRLSLFTMTEEYKIGANHVIKALQRFFNCKATYGQLPNTMFVQLNNCAQKNENRFVFSYIELLLLQNIFKQIEVAFFSMGHSHEEVDQVFRHTSCRLRGEEAITL